MNVLAVIASVTFALGLWAQPLRLHVGGQLPARQAAAYAYDAAGQLERIDETYATGVMTTAYEWDVLGRLARKERPEGIVTYDGPKGGAGVETVTSPHGSQTRTFGSDGRLRQIAGGGLTTDVAWEGDGERIRKLEGGGLTELRCYDELGRLTRVVSRPTSAGDVEPCAAEATTGALQVFVYAYDGRGNRLTETFREGDAPPEVTRYGYDAADRLTGVRYPDATAVLYELDGSGSRTGEKTVAAYPEDGILGPQGFAAATTGLTKWLTYHVDDATRLVGIDDELAHTPAGAVEMDDAGRITHLLLDGVDKQFLWDASGRMVRATVDGATTTYGYDPDGMRVSADGLWGSALYVWGDGELLEEQLTAGGQTTAYRYVRMGELVAGIDKYQGGFVQSDRVLRDGLGSITGRFTVGYGLAVAHRFDAWGSYRNAMGGAGGLSFTTPGVGDPTIGYTGHHWDAESGLTYGKARWLANGMGRWLSEDPVGVTPERMRAPGGMNTFGYANGNPGRWTDPSGLVGIVLNERTRKIRWVTTEGDSVSSIAEDLNVSVADIKTLNDSNGKRLTRMSDPPLVLQGPRADIASPKAPLLLDDGTPLLAGQDLAVPRSGHLLILETAFKQSGSKEYSADPPATGKYKGLKMNKCNLFVNDSIHEADPSCNIPFDTEFPDQWARAGTWANRSVEIPGWRTLAPDRVGGLDKLRTPVESLMPGDVVAWGVHYVDATGHVGIALGNVHAGVERGGRITWLPGERLIVSGQSEQVDILPVDVWDRLEFGKANIADIVRGNIKVHTARRWTGGGP